MSFKETDQTCIAQPDHEDCSSALHGAAYDGLHPQCSGQSGQGGTGPIDCSPPASGSGSDSNPAGSGSGGPSSGGGGGDSPSPSTSGSHQGCDGSPPSSSSGSDTPSTPSHGSGCEGGQGSGSSPGDGTGSGGSSGGCDNPPQHHPCENQPPAPPPSGGCDNPPPAAPPSGGCDNPPQHHPCDNPPPASPPSAGCDNPPPAAPPSGGCDNPPQHHPCDNPPPASPPSGGCDNPPPAAPPSGGCDNPPQHHPCDNPPPAPPPCDNPPPASPPPAAPPEAAPPKPEAPSTPPPKPVEHHKTHSDHRKVWGDPHLTTDNGTHAEDQIKPGKHVRLLGTSDHTRITGETSVYHGAELNHHPRTIFTKEAICFGDGQTKVVLEADGKAYLVKPDGKLGEQLKNGEVVSSSTNPNDQVTYDAKNGRLSYSFVDSDGNSVDGALQAHRDKFGDYISTSIEKSSGSFTGLLPALKPNLKDAHVDPLSGAGAFTGHRSNKNFYIPTLY